MPRPENALPDTPDTAGVLFFGIPLRARATATDWRNTCRDFNRTIASIYNQSNPNFRILVCCHDLPDLSVATDERIEFIKVYGPAPNLRADANAIFPDKARKMRKIAERFCALGGGWLMLLDADDLVSSQLVDFVAGSQDANGFILREGYLLDQETRALARVPHRQVFDGPFDQICGSCAILRNDGSPGAAERILRYFRADHRKYRQLAEEEGRPLAAIPFPAAAYVVNTGDNHSFLFGGHRVARRTTLLPQLRANAEPLTQEFVREFALDGPLWAAQAPARRAPPSPEDPAHPEFRAGFIGCGGMKCGSTALADYLATHPAIAMGQKKELHFFNQERHFRAAAPDYAPYHDRFARKLGASLYGEVTPSYVYRPQALMRIRAYNPDVKLLCIFRSPVDRAYSHWAMEVREGREPLSFAEALRAEPERLRLEPPSRALHFAYLDCGFYTEQVRRLWKLFRKEQVLFLKNEDLRNEPDATMDTVFRFLGLEPIAISRRIDARVGGYSQPAAAAERAFLLRQYEFDIRGLERMLDWDCSAWLR